MAATTSSPNSPEYSIPAALLNPKSEARTQLLTQLRLLHLLHHRNKNQHHRSVWYLHFNQFRRQVNALCLDLAIDLGPGFPASTPPTTKPAPEPYKGKRKAKASPKPPLPSPPVPNAAYATARIKSWLAPSPISATSNSLLTQLYTSFTSLLITPSFTPLASTLLAILARVCSITGLTAHLQQVGEHLEAAEEEKTSAEMGAVLERFAREDLGEVIGRVDVASPKASGRDSTALGGLSVDAVKKNGDDAGVAVKRSTLDVTLNEGKRQGTKHTEEPPTKKVKVRRKKKEDSIDDLFAGL